MLEDLQRSGINAKQARRLHYRRINAAEADRLVGVARAGYVIPYHDLEGNELDFYRVRFTEEPSGFKRNAKKVRRYAQPANYLPQFYLAPILDWAGLAEDVDTPLYITEGEKKAAKACLEGLPTIGLGGVWNWKSSSSGLPVIEDFEEFDWQGREVNLVFDSDYVTNPKVYRALLALCDELAKLGAYPYIIKLPALSDGSKAGLDDYLVEEGVDRFRRLPREEFEEARALWRMNDRYALIHNPAAVYDLHNHHFVNLSAFHMVAGNLLHHVKVVGKDDKITLKEVSTSKEWVRWRFRREHPTITYAPGKPPVGEADELNVWQPGGLKPIRSDFKSRGIQLYRQLLEHVFRNDMEHLHWFEQWVAYPLQNPGAKMLSAVILTGRTQGTGKSLLGETIGNLYGRNFTKITHQDLFSDFNSWMAYKQFILGEEISGTDKRAESDRLKHYITSNQITINAKYMTPFEIPNCANFMFTSNHADAFFLENEDRRYFVLNVDVEPFPVDVALEYDRWFKSDQLGELLYYFLEFVDTSDFNPIARPPVTSAKSDMIHESLTAVESFVLELKHDPEDVFAQIGLKMPSDLYTASDILEVYTHHQHFSQASRATSPTAIGKAMSKLGILKKNCQSKRYYVLRNVETWREATVADCHEHYRATHRRLEEAARSGSRRSTKY